MSEGYKDQGSVGASADGRRGRDATGLTPTVRVMPPCRREHELRRAQSEDPQEILTVGRARIATELVDVLDEVVPRKESVQVRLVARRPGLRRRLELGLLGEDRAGGGGRGGLTSTRGLAFRVGGGFGRDAMTARPIGVRGRVVRRGGTLRGFRASGTG